MAMRFLGLLPEPAATLRKTCLGACCLAFLASAGTSSAQTSNLNEELRELLKSHPQVRASVKTLESSKREVERNLADYWPTMNITADKGYERVDDPGTRVDGRPFLGRAKDIATATLTQNLFNGFLTRSRVYNAELNKEIADLTLEGTRQSTIFEGIGVYIDVLRQRRLIEIARTNERTIQRQLNLEDERVRRGSGVAVDVLQAKSRLQLAKERRVTFEGALEDAITRYKQVFNKAPALSAMTDPVPPIEIIPGDLEKAIDIALVENPAISNAVATMKIARAAIDQSKAEFYPTIDLVGKMNYEKNNAGELGTQRDWSVVVSADWDIFTGFSTKASVAKAAFDYGASKDQHEYTARRVVEQVRISWQALLTARQRLDLLENAVNIASEVFESRKKLREAGKETVINVLDAENEVNNAQIDYTAATYAERVSIYQLLLALGRLNAAYLGL